MPKIAYESWTPRGEVADHIVTAERIASEYANQGYDLTLRQLYYQFVARDLLPNSVRSYKNLGEWINKARHAGLVDWNHITDRTRNLAGGDAGWDSPADAIEGLASQYGITHWDEQPERVEVWVEKEALAGVVSQPADRLDVAYFSCRGYVSASEMWGAAMRLARYLRTGQQVTILHLGDHDPSGLDMTRDITDRLSLFLRHHLGSIDGFTVERIALNQDQIEQYDPPPNPAKQTDSRYYRYVEETGLTESWELDALEPSVLDALIEGKIREHLDQDLYDERLDREREERSTLVEVSARWDEIEEMLAL